jgi:hypothetical protein
MILVLAISASIIWTSLSWADEAVSKLTQWSPKNELVTVEGDSTTAGTFSKLEPELIDLPLDYVIVEAGMGGRWIIHMKSEKRKKLKPGKIKLTCEAKYTREKPTGEKVIHCLYKSTIWKSGKRPHKRH